MNVQVSEILLEIFTKLKNKGPFDRGAGICFNTFYNFGLGHRNREEVNEKLNQLISSWPDIKKNEDQTPNTLHPVEGNFDDYGKAAMSETLWENPRRLALLDFMIKTLEKEIEPKPPIA